LLAVCNFVLLNPAAPLHILLQGTLADAHILVALILPPSRRQISLEQDMQHHGLAPCRSPLQRAKEGDAYAALSIFQKSFAR
jgi:hypothetical protein